MSQSSDSKLLGRPLACFGLVIVFGVLGFSYAALKNNGFFLIGFLIPYVPCSLIACVLGAIFAMQAYRDLPSNHKGRYILGAVILLAIVVVGLFVALMVDIQTKSRP